MKALHEVFIERGITAPGWRLKFVSREIIGNSDWAWVYVEVYAPYKKKPCQGRKMAVNFVKGLIDWEKSEFYKYN